LKKLHEHFSESLEKKRARVLNGELWVSLEARKKISDALRGHICSDETKKKLSDKLKGRKNTWTKKRGSSNANI